MARTRCTVERATFTPFIVDGHRPYDFLADAEISIWLTRTYTDGTRERACLRLHIKRGYMTDGASTFWPVSLLVPQWRDGDDAYNLAPVAHDILYLLAGVIESDYEAVHLSREEVDDILRGAWRCWGMSRFLAGCADKGVEIFAGGSGHWGNDSYHVREFVSAEWETSELIPGVAA